MSCSPAKIDPTTPTGLTEDSVEYVRLRPATAADAEALALVGGAAFLEAFTWMLPGADIIDFCSRNHTPAAYAHYLAQPDTRITLAETLTGAPVGYSMLAAPDLPTMDVQSTDIELKRIYLLSRFRTLKTPLIAFGLEKNESGLEGDGLQTVRSSQTGDVALAAEGKAPAHTQPAVISNLRVGQALMDAAIELARSMGRTRLLLGTHAGNQRAIGFYHRNGFTEAGTRSFHVGAQVCCDYIFAKTL